MSPNLFPNYFGVQTSHDSKDESNTDIEICKQSEPRPEN